ncbi:hypothetical protein ORI89_16245 [Sphingobacterium sp. UT-1RO-CII-1]|nr:hypothetical protein [Sphingobacterium sp. UT-1RO-CII-1]MCY4781214.1 hypothetical protein [Sphingobacterium sp. UT-1RO-CII-1]
MLEKLKVLMDPNSFTYNFVKIGLFAVSAIVLFEAGKLVGGFLKMMIY